jgi:hypothetical protein
MSSQTAPPPASPPPTPLDTLLRGLFDDASLFPPTSLAMPDAVAGYVRHHGAWYQAMTGPFVCPEARIGDLRISLTAANIAEIDLSLVVTGGAEAVDSAVESVATEPRLRLRAVEVPARRDADPLTAVTEVVDALDRTLLAGAAGYVEVPVAALSGGVLDAVAARGYRPKLRTGGVTAAAFPDEAALAAALCAVTDLRVAFKCTAGLHHAVRHAADDTGFEHHGFLNVLFAVAATLRGADQGHVAAVLGDHDAENVADQVAGIGPDEAAMVRSLFTSFGTCSTDEPVADLAALGLADGP